MVPVLHPDNLPIYQNDYDLYKIIRLRTCLQLGQKLTSSLNTSNKLFINLVINMRGAISTHVVIEGMTAISRSRSLSGHFVAGNVNSRNFIVTVMTWTRWRVPWSSLCIEEVRRWVPFSCVEDVGIWPPFYATRMEVLKKWRNMSRSSALKAGVNARPAYSLKMTVVA